MNLKNLFFRSNKNILEDSNSDNNEFLAPEILPFSKNDKWGYITISKEILIKETYDEATPFINDSACVRNGKIWNLINCFGEEIAGPFKNVKGLKSGIWAVSSFNDKWGYIDNSGNLLIDLNYNEPELSYSQDLIPVHKNEYCALFSKEGKQLTDFKFDNIRYAGLNIVKAIQGDKYVFLDQKGARIIKNEFEHDHLNAYNLFSEGLAVASKNRKYGFINLKGEFEIQPKFLLSFPFSNGMALVEDHGNYFIDKNGKVLFRCKDYLYSMKLGNLSRPYFCNNLLALSNDGLIGFINCKFEIQIPFQYFQASYFRRGACAVQSFDLSWSLIDTYGNEIGKYDYIYFAPLGFPESSGENIDGYFLVRKNLETYYVKFDGTEYRCK